MTVAVLLGVLVVAGLVVAGALSRRRPVPGAAGARSATSTGDAVRGFFQFLLLLGLLIAAANGLTGLLDRLLDRRTTLARSEEMLALELTFVLIALPLWVALAGWTWRRLRSDPGEARSPWWVGYLTLVGLISLVVAMVGWHRTLTHLLSPEPWEATGLAPALVWTLVWAGHHWWGRRTAPVDHLLPLRLLGSLIGLLTAAVGMASLLAASLRVLLGLPGAPIVGTGLPGIRHAAVLFLVGAVVWVWHWLLDVVQERGRNGWLALVLLVGVGGGLLAAVVAASTLGYDVLVWGVGDPTSPQPREHFSDVPAQLAVVVTGLLLWWYHQEVLGARRSGERTEVRRVYEYLLSAVGLLAAGAGLVMVLVTIVEAIAAGPDLVVGGRALNALLGALVLLLVGVPVWWWHWRQAQAAREAAPAQEVASPARRFYLLVLFGLMGVVAVVALLTLVYLVLEDLLGSGVDVETLRRTRFALGILLTTALLAAYHWTIFRTDREVAAAGAPDEAPGRAPTDRRTVLLVGAPDPGLAQRLRTATGAQVQLVARADVEAPPWAVAELTAALEDAPSGDLVVLAEPEGLRVIPVRR